MSADAPTGAAARSCLPNLFLIGYRGTGKTTVGQIVAQRLGWRSVDADALLEARWGRSIRRIFAEEGEPGFREKEAALLEELCREQQQVIATGGGVVLRPANRECLQRSGRIVWLTAPPEILWQRLQADATTRERRPALVNGGLAEIVQLLNVRTPLYESCADYGVETAELAPERVAERILEWWHEAEAARQRQRGGR